MAFWEFLIQKEGDRSWLPLESSKVEVLEGRYRIVAHASQPSMAIEVRITHSAMTEMPPIRRTQKRFSRTNKNGLVVIMPFTRLLPGVWDLRCSSDLMAEMLGEGWQYAVRLQVLPLEVAGDEWDTDWQPGLTNPEEAPAQTPQPQERSEHVIQEHVTQEHVTQEHVTQEKIAAAEGQPALIPASESVSVAGGASELLPLSAHSVSSISDPSISETQDSIAALPNSPEFSETDDATPQPVLLSAGAVQVQLGQDTYVIQTGQPLTLMGQVTAAEDQAIDRLFPLEALQVRLYDPRTSQILVEQRQPLTTRRLPLPFTCRITLPDHLQTYLVLGEITIYGATAAGTAALVTQSFSVTTALHELLEAIANDFSEADLPLAATAPPAALEPLTTPVAPIQFQVSPQQPLPPQLRPADPDKTWQSLDLPSFYEAETTPLTESSLAEAAAVDPLEVSNLDSLDSTVNSDRVEPELASEAIVDDAANLTDSTGGEVSSEETTAVSPLPPFAPPLSVPPPVAQAFDNDAPLPDWDRDEPRSHWQTQNQTHSQATEKKTDSPEDMAFRSLNLQERFWTRLQALVADQELTEWLTTFDDEPWDDMRQSSRRSERYDAVLTAHEVVAEDELAPSEGSAIHTSLEFADQQTGVPVLSIQQAIPVPQLEVATGELTAGQSLPVQVRLPDLSHPLFVKLWLVDRQNRSVLDGPYWLTDFGPSGFDDLVCRYEVTVPQGCLELQLEAIAIEMTTQRESDKATVARSVVPANLTNLALDELDV